MISGMAQTRRVAASVLLARHRQQYQYAPAPQLGSGLQVTAIVAGIFGVIFGLIPLTFFLAWAFGLVALVVGIMAYRRAKAVGRKQGRAG
jgi:hypothetical protein